jgi:hypothetical protein
MARLKNLKRQEQVASIRGAASTTTCANYECNQSRGSGIFAGEFFVWEEELLRQSTLCIGILFAISAVASAHVSAQNAVPPSDAELAAIAERGRMLAEYDAATWHATDAVQMANPKNAAGRQYLAKKENGRWTVVFGALDADKTKFVIAYEAEQLANGKEFAVRKDEPAKDDTGFYLFAARALGLALTDFGLASQPYNVAVLAANGSDAGTSGSDLYVYVYPAQTKPGIYPLGGDVRYLISADGVKILSKRPLHTTVIENPSGKGKKVVAGMHTHILSDEPEDTDVLHVLQQDPPVPEMVATRHYVYEVASDGTIRIKKQKK